MPDALSFAEIKGLHVEPLAARTVLSLFSAGGRGSGDAGNNGGGAGIFNMMSDTLGHQIDSAGNGIGGAGGSANAGRGG